MFKITILTIAIFRVTTITKIIMITNQLKLKGYSKEPNEHISAVVAMFKITILTIRVITIAKIIMIRMRTDLKLERDSKEADEHISSGEVGDEQVGWLALQTPELSNLYLR